MIRGIVLALMLLATLYCEAQNLSIYRSEKGVDSTVLILIKIIQDSENLIFFDSVSHDAIARKRGMDLAPTRSILFEDPDLTTALISCQQTAAIDLPLEILVWEEYGDVYIGFVDPILMKKRFMISDCDETLDKLTRQMVKVTMDAIRFMSPN